VADLSYERDSYLDEIAKYHKQHSHQQFAVMEKLRELLDQGLGQESSRLWHGAPVWFVGENPVAGYSFNRRGVCLLFWNGRSFEDPSLYAVGKFFAAELRYSHASEIRVTRLRELIRLAKANVWDSAGYIRKARASGK
jgi:hypothetical protein